MKEIEHLFNYDKSISLKNFREKIICVNEEFLFVMH